MRKIRVMYKEPGEAWQFLIIADTLEDLQYLVDGYIEVVPMDSGWAVVCNEEGWLHGMDFNCLIHGIAFIGPIVLIGVDGEEFTDMPINPKFWD